MLTTIRVSFLLHTILVSNNGCTTNSRIGRLNIRLYNGIRSIHESHAWWSSENLLEVQNCSKFFWIMLQEDNTTSFSKWIWPSEDGLNSYLTRGESSLRSTRHVRGSINTRVSCSMKRWSHMKTHNRKQYDHYVEGDNITFIQQKNQLNLRMF